MDQSPSSSSDLQGGSIKYVLTVDDSQFVAVLQKDSKAAADFAQNLDKSIATTAAQSFEKLAQSGDLSKDVEGLKILDNTAVDTAASFDEMSQSANASATEVASSFVNLSSPADDFAKNVDKNTTAASASFDELTQSTVSSLQGLKQALNGNGANLQDALAGVALDNTGGVSSNIRTLAANLSLATERHQELLTSSTATDAEFVKSRTTVDNLTNSLKDAVATEEQTSNSTGKMGQSFLSMVGSMTVGTLAAIGISDAFNTVKASIMDTVSSAADLEQTKTTFTSLLGSVDAANVVLQQLSDLSMHSSFALPTLQAGAQQLINFGVSAKDVVPTITSLGDIAALVGTQKLPQLTYAYAQVAEQGNITSRQLTQFMRAGVPLLDELAKESGKTTAQIKKDMSSGGISFDQVRLAIANMTSEGGKFFDGMQKQSQTFNGTATDIVNQAGKIGRALLGISEGGDIQKGGIFDTLKNGLTDFMNFLSSNAGTIVTILQTAFSAVGMIGQAAFMPINAVLQLVSQNIAIVAAVLGALLVGFAEVKGIQLFDIALETATEAVHGFTTASLIATLTDPWLILGTVIAAVFGVVLFNTFTKLQGAMSSTANSTKSLTDNMGLIPNASDAAANGLDKVGQKIQDINDKIAKQQQNFLQSLAQAVKAHQDKAAQLQNDLNKENEAYADSVEKKKQSLYKENANLTKSHENHLIDLQRQLDKELATNHNANSLKSRDLQDAIAKENADYAQKNATNQQTYQTDVANAKEAHDQKVTDLTAQLKKETDLLSKHAADVASVKNVMLLDDIDKLKQSNADQLKSLNQQKQQTLQSVASTNNGVIQSNKGLADWMKNFPGFKDAGKQMGIDMGNAFKDALWSSIKDAFKGWYDFMNNIYKNVTNAPGNAVSDALGYIHSLGESLHFAGGGHINAGQGGWVGDNPDGSLNSTSEYFVPDVAGTIVPSSGVKGTGSRGNRPINVTYNVYNTTDQTRFLRDMAWQMGNA